MNLKMFKIFKQNAKINEGIYIHKKTNMSSSYKHNTYLQFQ